MSKNRVLYVLIALALLVAAGLSLQRVMVTKAAGSTSSLQADRSYQAVENIRQNRIAPATALKSGQCKDDECSYQLSNGQWVR